MDTGTLYVFHNAGNQHIHTIGDGIYLHFRALHIAVNQYRMVRGNFYCPAHVVAQFCLVVDNLHGAAAQYIGGAHHDRIADISCAVDGILQIGDAESPRTRNLCLGQHFVKALPVFCPVNIIYRCAKDLDPGLLQGGCQIYSCLSAKLNDNAFRLFLVDDVQHIFRGQRLEVKPVGNIKVRRYGFRVVIDDDGFNAHFL